MKILKGNIKQITNPLSISFCTVCMDRLIHLKETLPENIKICEKMGIDYEFCLINWNSRDGLDEWVKNNYTNLINSNKIKYYHTIEPTEFHMTIPKNIAIRMSTKKYFGNIDADNLFTEDYIKFLIDNLNEDVYIKGGRNGSVGRIICPLKTLIDVGGYDEIFDKYGYEDIDLKKRLDRILKRLSYDKPMEFIDHEDDIRLINFNTDKTRNQLKSIAREKVNNKVY